MKRGIIVLGVCLFICASVLPGCKSSNNGGKQPAETKGMSESNDTNNTIATGKIAYVNIDTLEANYIVLKSERADFQKRQAQMESELQRSYQKMQSDAQEVQKKAQANTLTQAEYEAAQKRLYLMQKSLESRKQSLTDQLMKAQDDISTDLHNRLDSFLHEYNKTHHYEYILSYSYTGSSLLYANKKYDITKDVVDGMNAAAKQEDSLKGK